MTKAEFIQERGEEMLELLHKMSELYMQERTKRMQLEGQFFNRIWRKPTNLSPTTFEGDEMSVFDAYQQARLFKDGLIWKEAIQYSFEDDKPDKIHVSSWQPKCKYQNVDCVVNDTVYGSSCGCCTMNPNANVKFVFGASEGNGL